MSSAISGSEFYEPDYDNDVNPSKPEIAVMVVGIVLGSLIVPAASILAVEALKRKNESGDTPSEAPKAGKIPRWCRTMAWFAVFWSKVWREKQAPEISHEQAFSDKMVTVREGGDADKGARPELVGAMAR